MALATKCPHCGTTFRVAADQLKLRGGIVRCGACQHIFDGNASLIDLDAPAAQLAHAEPQDKAAQVEAAAASEPHAAPGGATEPECAPEPEPIEIPVYEVDLEPALDPQDILPKPGTEPDASESASDTEEIEVIDLAGQPGLLEEPPQSVQPAPAVAKPPEDETVAAPEVTHDHHEVPEVLDVEAQAVEAHAGAGDGQATDAEPADEALTEPAARAASEHKPVFSMGSALLSEPDHPPAHSEGRIEPTLELPVDEELVAAPPPRDHDEPVETLHAQADTLARYAGEHTPLPLREASEAYFSAPAAAPAAPAKPRSRLGRRSKLTPTKIAPPKLRVPEIDEPEFVKRSRQQEQSGKRRRILMAVGSAVLALALVAQVAATFRNDLAARVPAMKPGLAALCSLLGCRVELPARIENLTIETGDLQATANDVYVLSTLLHNQAGTAQAWPAIELALLDANDKLLLRRVFTPAEYLPQGLSPAAGFGPHAEQPVKLYFQLNQLKPSGYHIAVFYL